MTRAIIESALDRARVLERRVRRVAERAHIQRQRADALYLADLRTIATQEAPDIVRLLVTSLSHAPSTRSLARDLACAIEPEVPHLPSANAIEGDGC